MKKQWKRLAALSSAAVMAAGTLLYFPTDTLQNISWGITASAEETGAVTWNEDNLTWTLDAEGTLTISGSGAMKDYAYNTNNSPAYNNSNIKKVVIEDGVTSIGEYAFQSCTGLTSIKIPKSVTNIGECAFYRCTDLKSIEIPDSVTSIGNYAFSDCTSLTSITIPSSVKSIGNGVFSKCNKLTVYLENGSALTSESLGVDASKIRTYWNEDSLTWTLDAEGTLTISGTGAMKDYFHDSPATQKKDIVKKVVIEEGVTSIGDYAFFGYSSLTSIEIPESVTSIGIYAFFNCTGLKSITIPKSVASVGDKAFSGCIALKEVLLEGGSTLTSENFGEVADKVVTRWNEGELTWTLTADGTMTISGTGAMKEYYGSDNSPAYYNSKIKKVVIENGITSIGAYAFSGCTNLASIEIPSSVTSIGNGAFSDCSSLTDITIPSSVTSIGDHTFYGCNSLTGITIPESVTSIGASAFYDTPWLTNKQKENNSLVIVNGILIDGTVCSGEVTIPDGVTSIGNSAFFGCSNMTSINIPKSVTSIGNGAFSICTGLTSINIPENVTSIGNGAFQRCSNLASIKIPDGVKSIEDNAFYECTGLTGITIPESVTSIGKFAFYNCTGLTSIEIPEGVTSIGEYAFDSCNKLASITIPSSVTSIGVGVFNHCSSLKEVLLENGSTLTSGNLGANESQIGTYWNEDNLTWTLTADGTMTISGKGAMKAYNWDSGSPATQEKDSVKKVVIEDGVTSIGDYAFFDCNSLTDITIPSSITSIGICSFYNCSNLASIAIPSSVTSIGESAFFNCIGLTNISIPKSVTSIGDSAFFNCIGLTNISIPKSVTSIGNYAFYKCISLTDITIPDSVTSIGDYAFYKCNSLTDITIPDSITSIGNYAFCNYTGLTSIKIPKSVTNIGEFAFSGCGDSLEITVSCDSTLTKKAFGDASEKVKYRHSLVKTDAKDATYTEVGNVEYWTCENCKKHFLSDETDAEVAKEVELSEIVKPVPVQVATATTQIKCVYDQDMDEIDLQDYVKNADAVGGVSVKVATGSTMLDGMQLDGSKLSGKPTKVYTNGKDVTFTFTAKNGNTANLTLNFLVAKADPTVKVAVDGDTHTEGDLVSELKLILSGNNTKGLAEIISEIKALTAGENTLTWKFTPEDSENYNVVTGTVVVNAQTTTTTTTTTITTTTTNETTVATKASTVTTNETIATTEETTTTNETTATTATSGTTATTSATKATTTNETTSTTQTTTSASSTESTSATSATTITTAATTSVTNIADEDLCSWAINDYQKKTGVTPANAEITARSEETCEITLTDENGNVLDIYTIDPKTGTGTDSSNVEVNLPQTGNNSMTNWLLCVGAAMFMAFGFGAVKASGVLKRKEDE